ncbi:peptide ABC transporter substrate-binding protein [Virgibacillus necropolis]|uniref:Peptide ABC transporter substrate-binding protein n=1 Tax=Virgibacillus necropolis TaxID=163877 RepID=A0A221MA60_9BACI|nr:peptide ABC transporter substrate-binding protein [Virgibacillus necropolis]ASN04548.1 peptide ABC transporter substrate-binding protein [Virgibacillus necropolis]
MSKKKLWNLCITVFCLSLLVGCYGGEPVDDTEKKESQGSESSVLHLATTGEIPTLKTNGTMDGLSQTIIMNIFEGLYRQGPDHEPIEGMAKDYEASEDGKKLTFHLKEDATWSNGDPVTAHDFVYAWKKALHPDTFSPHAYMMGPIKNATDIQDPDSELFGKVEELGVKATSDYTLEVVLESNVPYFFQLLTHPVFYPQNEKFVESQNDNYALEVENLIFNGPFILDSWDHGQGWILKKNTKYWDAKNVKVDQIDFKIAKETSTEVNLYESDTIDVANLSSEFVDVYKDHEDYRTSLESEMYFMRFNQKNKYLANVSIRKAIDMAWDKEKATEIILKNGSVPAYYLIPHNFTKSPDGVDFRKRYGDLNKGSIEKAQELWKKGLKELGESEISLELLSYDDGQRKSVAEYIKNQLEKNLPGLSIAINQQPNKQKLALEDKQEYDISYSGWRSDVNDPVDFLSVFLSDGPYNWQDFENKEYDNLVKKAQTDFTNLEQRFSNLQEAERILIDEEAAISPLYQAGKARLIKPYVKGFVAHPNSTYTYKWVHIENK